jgi:hypothetical protein
MTRTQISLTEEQYRFLVDMSRQTGNSISAIIRSAVDQYRSCEETPNRKALRLVGAFKANRNDISVRHDEILWNAIPDDERNNA